MPKVRRPPNAIRCNGQCGDTTCQKVFKKICNFKHHTTKIKRTCAVCNHRVCTKQFFRHVRRVHKDICDAHGACRALGVPRLRVRRKLPAEFQGKINASQWQWMKSKIHNHIRHDETQFPNWTSPYTAFDLTTLIVRYLLTQNLVGGGSCFDDAGGYLPYGFVMIPYALFQVSCDRIDTTRPHFPDPSNIKANIHFVILGMNTSAQIVGTFGTNACNMLRNCEDEPVTMQDLRLQLYKSCWNAYQRDDACQASFKSVHAFYQYCRTIVESQEMRCAVSNISMVGRKDGRVWRRISIDAICPTQGHVRRNIRAVCMFLNSSNAAKKKNYNVEDDEPEAWTTELYNTYLQK